MRKLTAMGLVVAWLGLCCLPAFAQGDANQKRRNSLSALYSARWTETICGFHFNDHERAKLVDAIAFMEGRLTDTPAQKQGLDALAKISVQRLKDKGDCDANGRFDKLVRKMIVDLPEPDPPKTAPAPR